MDVALFSLAGIIIGAGLQYYFTKHIENERHRRELRSKAYMDFLKCVAELANLRLPEKSKERVELIERTADAKSRICLYGASKVIKAYSKWERLGPTMQTKEQRDSFINLISEMRKDSGSELKVTPQDLSNVLLGFHKETIAT